MLFILRQLRRLELRKRSGQYFVYALGEIVLIVIGILLALQISEWNQARKDRIEETEILMGLKREFIGYQQALTEGIEKHEGMMSAMLDFLGSMEAGEWMSEEWTIDEAMDGLLSPPTTDFGNGVRDALVQGGRMEIITNRTLREHLANWPKHYGELKDDQDISRSYVLNQLIPHLTAQGIELGTALKDWGGGIPGKSNPIGENSKTIDLLLSDQTFKSMVQVRFAFWGRARGEFELTIEAMETILDLIEQELDGRN